jgi:1-acyl-sn-glycerol-3-phosphate acyltransferase
MTSAVLTPSFYARYRVLPQRPWWDLLAFALRAEMKLAGFRVDVDGAEKLPRGPAMLCTNHTQTYDFLALMKGCDQIGRRVVTVTKAKNYHHGAMSFVLKRAGVVPLASRGYFVMTDFVSVHRRRPSEREYRALRDHLDHDVPLPDDFVFAPIAEMPRLIAGHLFVPSTTSWRTAIERVFSHGFAETLRLARSAVHAGFDVQIYPEGTVSPRLGIARTGAAMIARALGLPMVPVGMSGCASALVGFVPKRGHVRIQIGDVLDDSGTFDDVTARWSRAVELLIDPELRRRADVASSKGTAAHL